MLMVRRFDVLRYNRRFDVHSNSETTRSCASMITAYCVGFASMIIAYCVGFASMIIAYCVGFASMIIAYCGMSRAAARVCYVRVGVGSAVSSRLLLSG